MSLSADFEKRYPGGTVIRGRLDWQNGPARVLVLFGPSGCGKTTILRCLAGLERPERGFVRFGHEVWFDADRRISLPPQRRGVGSLFQEYALFPHLTVGQNIAFGLRARSRRERDAKVADWLSRFQLEGFERRLPSQLSGGQQQRVALARTLAATPRVLCLDEPLSALDAPTRAELRISLRAVLRSLTIPTVLVTHEADEALALADEVAILSNGEIRQFGGVEDVFAAPRDAEVARIVGFENILPCLSEPAGRVHLGPVALRADAQSEGRGQCAFRAADVELFRDENEVPAENTFPATVVEIVPETTRTCVLLSCPGRIQAALLPGSHAALGIHPGDRVLCRVPAESICVFNGEASVS
ncbi:MAG TPA: ABC transporter ATP-binding protein [Planctomycetaceae bacterium]|nr:ABC transporter ATP-binding protein [Planctomycetaceae bacterium]